MIPCVREVAQPLTSQRFAEGISVPSEPKPRRKTPSGRLFWAELAKINVRNATFRGHGLRYCVPIGFLRWTEEWDSALSEVEEGPSRSGTL
eukprot:268618-Amphidinium_carterae.1